MRAQQRYRGLLEGAPDPMVVVSPCGVIVLVNVQAEKQFGYSRDELIGRKVTRMPSALSSGLSMISIGNSRPSRRSAVSSIPVPTLAFLTQEGQHSDA